MLTNYHCNHTPFTCPCCKGASLCHKGINSSGLKTYGLTQTKGRVCAGCESSLTIIIIAQKIQQDYIMSYLFKQFINLMKRCICINANFFLAQLQDIHFKSCACGMPSVYTFFLIKSGWIPQFSLICRIFFYYYYFFLAQKTKPIFMTLLSQTEMLPLFVSIKIYVSKR